MYPIINIFGKAINSYMILSIIGVLVTGIVLYLLNRKREIKLDQLLHISLAAIAGMIIGGHILYGITQIPYILNAFIHNSEKISTLNDLYLLLTTRIGGMVFYGGLFGGLIGGYIYSRHLLLDFRSYTNALAPGIPLFHAFGRIGCFLSGCCYGIESNFGFIYKNSLVREADHVQRFPVQLLEASFEIFLFIVLSILLVKFGNRFSLIRIYLIFYSIIRFLDEFLRGDLIRGIWGPFSTSQWISLIIITILTIEYTVKRKRTIK